VGKREKERESHTKKDQDALYGVQATKYVTALPVSSEGMVLVMRITPRWIKYVRLSPLRIVKR
jgi:hypothetical protein